MRSSSRGAGEFEPASYARWFESPLGRRAWEDERRALGRVAGPVSGRSVLDVGAGEGRFTVDLTRAAATVVGVDRSRSMLRAARERTRAASTRVAWVRGDAGALPFPDETFDVVMAVTLLCFVREPAAVVREMARVTRREGRVVLGELGRWSPWALRRRLRGWRGDETWARARFWTRRELRSLLEEAGLRPAAAAAAVFYPPSLPLARAFRRIDAWLGRRLPLGAAFLAVAGTRDIVSPRRPLRPRGSGGAGTSGGCAPRPPPLPRM